MTTINIDFKGYIQVDYVDLKISKIDDKGDYVPVDISTITPQEAVEGIKKGDYYLDLKPNLDFALDGEETIEASIEEE
jgi:hypothetical protein